MHCLNAPPCCGAATHPTYPTKPQQFQSNRDFSSFSSSYKALRFTAIELLKNPTEQKRKKEGNQFSKYIWSQTEMKKWAYEANRGCFTEEAHTQAGKVCHQMLHYKANMLKITWEDLWENKTIWKEKLIIYNLQKRSWKKYCILWVRISVSSWKVIIKNRFTFFKCNRPLQAYLCPVLNYCLWNRSVYMYLLGLKAYRPQWALSFKPSSHTQCRKTPSKLK